MPKGFSYRRMLEFLASCVLFAIISTLAVATAMGYNVDFEQDHVAVQETGIIQLNSPLAGLPVEVYLDGNLKSRELPVRFAKLEPKQYSIELRREGYQQWIQVVQLQPNQRAVFNPIVLLYLKPELKPETVVTASDERFSQLDAKNLEIRSANEVWLAGEFITRTSKDIMSLRWFPERDFIVIQDAGGLTLLAIDGSYTQTITTVPQKQETTFFFTEGGRVLYLQDGGLVQRAELYEYTSFIDRLGVGLRTANP